MTSSSLSTRVSAGSRAQTAWHALAAPDALATVGSQPTGLTSAEATDRLQQTGRNELRGEKRETWWEELLESLREPLQLLLIAVGVLYAVFGRLEDAVTIFVVIVLVSVIEAVNESRAKKAIASLRTLSAPRTVVVRAGSAQEIESPEVVPGDIVLLQQGSRVTADLRLVESAALRIDESSLTGESAPVEKNADLVLGPETLLADRVNMAYTGTSVTGGRGRGVVVATGPATELGRIAGLTAQARESRTPLQRQLGQLAHWLLWVAVVLSALVPTLGVLIAHQPVREMILSGLTLAFATIPEELPILITIVLGLGAYRLAREGAITRRLEAAEALGSVTLVGTDKTGTLTENRMRVAEIFVDGATRPPDAPSVDARRVLEIGALANEAQEIRRDGAVQFAGDPTDTALLEAAERMRVETTGSVPDLRVVQRVPFDESRRRITVVYEQNGAHWLVTKGAPEMVLGLAAHIRSGEGVRPMDDGARSGVVVAAEQMAARGLRVLAFAERALTRGDSVDAVKAETRLTLVGLAGLEDPPRPEAAPAIAALRDAGVRTVMMTGDHPSTARAIAGQVGIDAARVVTGSEVESTADAALGSLAESASVFARITPEHKLRIVRALQTAGEVVAVTGDGVNDAPALREATIGVAMGQRGTDVAREAADVVLADDNLATIVTAVRGGRVLYENLRKAVRFYLAAKVALVSATLVAVLAQVPLPFWPVQMIVLELFMDLGASTTFVVEPPEGDVMARPPRDPRRPFMDGSMIAGIFAGGLSLGAAVTVAYLWTLSLGGDIGSARTAAFAAWMIGHIVLAAHMRAERQPIFAGGFALTWPFALWSFGAILLAIFGSAVPLLHRRLALTALSSSEWRIVALSALLFPSWIEVAKWLRWRAGQRTPPPARRAAGSP